MTSRLPPRSLKLPVFQPPALVSADSSIMVYFCMTSKPSCSLSGGISTGLLLSFLALAPLSAVVAASPDLAPFRGPALDRRGAVGGPVPETEGSKIEFVSFRYSGVWKCAGVS